MLYDELRSFKETNFRSIYQRYIYIDCQELLHEMFPQTKEEELTGLFAYCYIDGEEGITFRPFMMAKICDNSMQACALPNQNDTIYVLRLREGETKLSELHRGDMHMYLYAVNPSKCKFLDLSLFSNISLDAFSSIKEEIDDNYKVDDDRELLRSDKFEFLDPYRNGSYPDDVSVLLFKEELGIEQVWVRATIVKEKELYGILLNEPKQDFGCHKGDIIGFGVVKVEEQRVLAHTGNVIRDTEN